MAEKIVSPGVFTRENDLSFLPQGIGEIGAAVVGPTVKGPAGIPTAVSSYAEYVAKFGDTFQSGSDTYEFFTSIMAERYLQNSGVLTVVRLTGDNPAVATASVGGGAAATPGTVSSASLQIGLGMDQEHEVSIGGVDFTFVESVVNFNNSATQIFVVSGSNATNNATNLAAAINDSSSLHGLNVVASASAVGYGDGSIVALTASVDGTAGNLTLASASNAPSGAFTFGNEFSENAGVSGVGVHGQTTLLGGVDGANTTAFTLHTHAHGVVQNSDDGDGTHTEGVNNTLASGSKDNLRYEISGLNNSLGTFNVLIRRGNDTKGSKVIMEQFNGVSLDPNSSNYIAKVIGDSVATVRGTADDPYIQYSGSYRNKSQYVRVSVQNNTVDYLDENGNVRDGGLSSSLPAEASGTFGGAADGNTLQRGNFTFENVASTNVQGMDLNDLTNVNGGARLNEALNLLANQDFYDINMLVVPGINQKDHSAAVAKVIDVCEERADCFAIVDPVGYGQTPALAYGEADDYNTSYAAMYWPWVKIPNNTLGKDVWVPPSVVMPGVLAYNDTVAAEWYAPAGLNRGGILAVQAERNLTHTNRDNLYENRVNPIATFPGVGVCAWGQKTLQKRPSALDRINVRRLLINLKKFIASTSKYLVFEQNTAATRNRFLSTVVPYMEEVQANQGLYAFRVVMDDSNNTPDVIDRNIMKGDIFIQPARAAEFIVVDFNIMPTGATFND